MSADTLTERIVVALGASPDFAPTAVESTGIGDRVVTVDEHTGGIAVGHYEVTVRAVPS